MRKLLSSISALVIILIGCAGPKAFTKNGEVIPPNTNRIYIYTKDSPDTAFHKFGRFLKVNGYDIEYSDDSFKTITTDSKPLGPRKLLGHSANAILKASILKKGENTVIRVRGTCNHSEPIRLFGQKGTPARLCWNAMYSVAKKYKGEKLEFGTE